MVYCYKNTPDVANLPKIISDWMSEVGLRLLCNVQNVDLCKHREHQHRGGLDA